MAFSMRTVLGAILLSGALTAAVSCGDEDQRGSGCGETPAASECTSLCEDSCSRLAACGFEDTPTCTASCFKEYACPGETPGQDAAICSSEATRIAAFACSDLCAWADPWSGLDLSAFCGGGGGSGGSGGSGGAAGGGGE